jgi:hypothetical protein
MRVCVRYKGLSIYILRIAVIATLRRAPRVCLIKFFLRIELLRELQHRIEVIRHLASVNEE